jgi:hypothetical protein
MGKERQSRLGYRDPNDGRFISEEEADRRRKEDVTRERIPLPGFGDTARYDKDKG